MDEAFKARVSHAVEDLHADLALWLGSDAPSAVCERFIAAQHPDFTMVTADGQVVSRDELATGLAQAGNTVPGLTIAIEDLRVVAADGDLVVVRFTEAHHRDGTVDRRRTTATLTVDMSVEEGLRWLSVHETRVGSGGD